MRYLIISLQNTGLNAPFTTDLAGYLTFTYYVIMLISKHPYHHMHVLLPNLQGLPLCLWYKIVIPWFYTCTEGNTLVKACGLSV